MSYEANNAFGVQQMDNFAAFDQAKMSAFNKEMFE
jgi:hypothetical protein